MYRLYHKGPKIEVVSHCYECAMNADCTTLQGYLNKRNTVRVDRPLGSKHPEFNTIYELNYGFVEGTRAADGEPIDAYILGITEPVVEFTGICIGIVCRSNDLEGKLLVIPKGRTFSVKEIKEAISFQEKYFVSEIRI